MESDNYSRRIEYSQLTNIQEMPLLQHGYTHIADLPEPITDKKNSSIVILKQIMNGQNAELYDFCQVIVKQQMILR